MANRTAACSIDTYSIAILGAECTGKSQLASALTAHFAGLGRSVHCVPEYLREWCDAHGRTPLAHEQAAIAAEQARRVLQAPPVEVLIVDTTPLMTAVYSDIYFDDTSLYDSAALFQQQFSLNLLAANDLPWKADGLQRDGTALQVRVQARLRQALLHAGLAFHEVTGLGQARLSCALSAIPPHPLN